MRLHRGSKGLGVYKGCESDPHSDERMYNGFSSELLFPVSVINVIHYIYNRDHAKLIHYL